MTIAIVVLASALASAALLLAVTVFSRAQSCVGRGACTRRRRGVASAAATLAIAVGAAVAMMAGDARGETPMSKEISAGVLKGTLLSPGAGAPVAIIVPGSGPTDRDGNNPLGVKGAPYRMLAEALAERGVATVRIDKRGMFGSAGEKGPHTLQAYAGDVHAWIDAAKAGTGASCIWLVGHSEGALVVSAAADGRADVCGLVLVSGMGRRFGDVLRAQLQQNPANAPILGQALPAIAELEAGRRVDASAMHPALLSLFSPAAQDLLISEFRVDPVELVTRAGRPALIVQGLNDMQITEQDARLLAAAPRTELFLVPGMNHLLELSGTSLAETMASYADPDAPLAPGVSDRIAGYIKGGGR